MPIALATSLCVRCFVVRSWSSFSPKFIIIVLSGRLSAYRYEINKKLDFTIIVHITAGGVKMENKKFRGKSFNYGVMLLK